MMNIRGTAGAPLAFVVEAAGGASHSGAGSVLDQTIGSADERLVISLGSRQEVARTADSLSFQNLYQTLRTQAER